MASELHEAAACVHESVARDDAATATIDCLLALPNLNLNLNPGQTDLKFGALPLNAEGAEDAMESQRRGRGGSRRGRRENDYPCVLCEYLCALCV